MGYTHLIFDFDGTLFNSAKGIKNGFKYALKHFGIKETNEARLESFIGPPLSHSFGKTYGFKGDELLEIIRVFRIYYSDKGYLESELYPGVEDLLIKLKKQAKILSIATAKPTHYAKLILEANELQSFFMPVCGSEMHGDLYPKDVTIGGVLEFLNPKKAETVMIGDTIYDLQGAKYHNLASIAVNYGYGQAEDLKNEQPTYFVESVAELSNLLLR